MVKKISQNEFNEAESCDIAVIDFSASWCGPCKMLAPVLEEVSEEYTGKISFFNIDVDENVEIAMKYRVASIPALLVLKKGQKADMQIGFVPKEELEDFLNRQL